MQWHFEVCQSATVERPLNPQLPWFLLLSSPPWFTFHLPAPTINMLAKPLIFTGFVCSIVTTSAGPSIVQHHKSQLIDCRPSALIWIHQVPHLPPSFTKQTPSTLQLVSLSSRQDVLEPVSPFYFFCACTTQFSSSSSSIRAIVHAQFVSHASHWQC